MPQNLPRGGAEHEREVRQKAQRQRRAHRRDGGRGHHLGFLWFLFAFARLVRVHVGRGSRRARARARAEARRVRLDRGDERLDRRRKRRRRRRPSVRA